MNLFSPNIAHASLDSFLTNVNNQIVNPLIAFMFALAIGFFLYGMFEFIANQDNDEKKTTGKSHMVWGIVGLAIMMGVWGILRIVLNTFNIDSSGVKIEIENNKGTPKVELKDYDPNYPR
jgi:uncharacterized membrane protein YidH (DUF202 family)